MKITKLKIKNYRLLRDFSIDLEEELSLIIGKNNTGKTSILTVLDKFLNEREKFRYDDFNISFRKELEEIILSSETPIEDDWEDLGIKLRILIEYSDNDNLSNVSRVLMDLDPDNNFIVLGFDYILTYTKLQELKKDYSDFIEQEKNKVSEGKKKEIDNLKDFFNPRLDKYFEHQKKSIYYNIQAGKIDESNYIRLDKENISIRDIINFKFISARRDVTNKEIDKTLSKQTSILYKKKEDNEDSLKASDDFKDQLSITDYQLSGIYKNLFENIIKNISLFGGTKINETQIEIISTLQHQNLLESNTTVVYAQDEQHLPENFNGLGYLNLINMIFEIEILLQDFKKKEGELMSDINLLFIEEPEAHTHPQMQYIFIKNIKKLLKGSVSKNGKKRTLQSIISTHSSHIVADSDFEDIKYLQKHEGNIQAKNLSELNRKYEDDSKQYQFLKQYLTISRAEIFFADKAILIEGDTERILLPAFMRKIDLEESARLEGNNERNEDKHLPLLSQNISIMEVGAYSHIFKHFIEFIGIKSLILTDIDAVNKEQNEEGIDVYKACRVEDGMKTSNTAINYYLSDVSWEDLKTSSQKDRIVEIGTSKVKISYQLEENDYHARSFEDAFIHLNKQFIKENKNEFQGIKNASYFEDEDKDSYVLANSCIKKKTHFALDILYQSNDNFSNWDIPEYIKNGLLWLKED